MKCKTNEDMKVAQQLITCETHYKSENDKVIKCILNSYSGNAW